MIKVYQDKFGQEGNCWAACVATITGIPLDAVPNILEMDEDGWYGRFSVELQNHHGWNISAEPYAPAAYSIGSGMGPRGRRHAVVMFGRAIFHDPHPEGGMDVANIDSFDLLTQLKPE